MRRQAPRAPDAPRRQVRPGTGTAGDRGGAGPRRGSRLAAALLSAGLTAPAGAAEVCLPLPASGDEPAVREVTVQPFGRLRLTATRDGHQLQVQVQDDGDTPLGSAQGLAGIGRLPVYLRHDGALRPLEIRWETNCPP